LGLEIGKDDGFWVVQDSDGIFFLGSVETGEYVQVVNYYNNKTRTIYNWNYSEINNEVTLYTVER